MEDHAGPNPYGIAARVIPRNRCAYARDVGSRMNNNTALNPVETRLPHSGESVADFPIFFHYVNVGPNIREEEMIRDVYLPLK